MIPHASHSGSLSAPLTMLGGSITPDVLDASLGTSALTYSDALDFDLHVAVASKKTSYEHLSSRMNLLGKGGVGIAHVPFTPLGDPLGRTEHLLFDELVGPKGAENFLPKVTGKKSMKSLTALWNLHVYAEAAKKCAGDDEANRQLPN